MGTVMLSIAASARVSPLADIEDSQRGSRITIEDDVVIDAFVKLKARLLEVDSRGGIPARRVM